MKGILSKALVFSFFLFSIFYFLPSVAHANTTQTHSASSGQANYPAANTNPDVPNNLHNWTQNVMIEVMSALTCQLAGVDPINPKQGCLGIDSASGKIGFVQNTGLPAEASAKAGGAIGFMGNMIATLYTPPLHTSDYFQNLAQNFGISKHAFAQNAGTGFQGLSPLIGVWSAFRNIVYLFLVIVFVVIGLAIMLRIKIDPRTVMSIQNQIPKIIIGILVVTFSFAIAGFLIDLMWVFIYLIYGIFIGIPGVNLDNLNLANIQGQNALGAVGFDVFKITSDAAGSTTKTLQNFLGIEAGWSEIFNPFALVTNFFNPNKIGNVANWFIDVVSTAAGAGTFKFILDVSSKIGDATKIPFINAIPYIGPAVNDTITGFVKGNGVVSAFTLGGAAFAGTEALLRNWLPYLIAYLIIFIALLTALFRLWFTLIMAYVQILLAVVLAPFWIIGGIVPGSPISLSGWLRDISANLLAFPVTIGMFMLGKVFMDAFGECPAANPSCLANSFVPPLIGNPGEPSLIGSLIGLGIILMTPNVVNMLKTALKAPKLDTGLGKAIGAGTAVIGGTTKSTVGAGVSYLAGDPLTKEKGIQGVGRMLQRRIFGG